MKRDSNLFFDSLSIAMLWHRWISKKESEDSLEMLIIKFSIPTLVNLLLFKFSFKDVKPVKAYKSSNIFSYPIILSI